ncbi:MAG: EamA family transporter [Hyphomicrobiales bacterium]|nr:EamA family transporter [Hyphomicrobiales bacterium]MCP5371161.1 EamA family transporter [Hyphomicrobiales bacterium]
MSAPGAGAGRAPSTELALLVLLAVLWGSSYPLIKVALATIPPVTLIALRVTLAAAVLGAVMAWRGDRPPRPGPTWGRLLVQAQLNSVGAWLLLAWGQQHVDSGLACVLNSTSPLFVFLITLLFTRHEPTGGLRLVGAGLGLAGVVLIVGAEALAGLGTQVLAQGAVLLGAVLYAGAAIHGRRFAGLSPVVTAAGTLAWATLCLVPLSLVLDRPWLLRPSAQSLVAALALSLFCTGGALLIYFRLVRTLGSLGVASQAYLRAGVGVLLGVVVLGERLAPATALGLAAVILGVAAINRRPAGPPRT